MPGSESLQPILDELTARMPIGFDVLIGLVGLWGVFLWLFGRRLVRPTLAMMGLVGGAAIGALIARDWNTLVLMGVIMGGAIFGAIVLYVTWRLWTAALLACVLALAAPWAVLAWHNQSPPRADRPLRQTAKQVIVEGVETLHDPGSSDDEEPIGDRIIDGLRKAWDQLRDWWADDLGTATKAVVMTTSGIMIVAGLIVGLLMPNFGSSLLAALAGALLILMAVLRLGYRYLAETLADWLPDSPRAVLLSIIALTLIGTLIQWTILRPRADKQ